MSHSTLDHVGGRNSALSNERTIKRLFPARVCEASAVELVLAASSGKISTMNIELVRRTLKRRYPFRIARGISTETDNLFLYLRDGSAPGLVGIGECAPSVADTELADLSEAALRDFKPISSHPRDLYEQGRQSNLPMPALCALDVACWDLLAKRAGIPLRDLLGFGPSKVPTSITIGINPPEVTKERVEELLDGDRFRYLKVKLGASEGLAFDQAHFEAARQVAEKHKVTIRVDANCGWSLPDALTMMRWLEERGVDYIEQPLAKDAFKESLTLFEQRSLPIYLDESCQTAADVIRWADRCDGVNLKLMKCGGITGALRIIETARALGLKLMIGCMGESSISISAGAALGNAFDHIDLDSHLKLADDPAMGATLENGVVRSPDAPGHGAELR